MFFLSTLTTYLSVTYSKAELAELGKRIDTIHKQQRLPLDEELDWIMVSLLDYFTVLYIVL